MASELYRVFSIASRLKRQVNSSVLVVRHVTRELEREGGFAKPWHGAPPSPQVAD